MSTQRFRFLPLTLLLVLAGPWLNGQVDFPSWDIVSCNTLDELPVGSLAASGSDYWFNFVEDGPDAEVTTFSPVTGNRSLRLDRVGQENFDDVLYSLDGENDGRYRLEWSMFLPPGSVATAGLINDFDFATPANSNWGYRIEFNGGGTATVLLGQSGNQLVTALYPRGRWFEIVQVIDLSTDEVRLFIDGNHVADWPLSAGDDTPGNLSLDYVNIWTKIQNGTPANQSSIYVDNMCFSKRNPFIFVDCFEEDLVCVAGEDFFNDCIANDAGYTFSEWTRGSCEGGGGEGNICELAIPLACNTTYLGDNFESENNFGIEDYTCHTSSSNYAAGDEVFRIDHPGGRFVVSLMNNENVDFDLFLLQDAACNDGFPGNLEEGMILPSCLDKSVNPPGGTFNREIIYYPLLDPGTYYLVVDGSNSDQVGSYELALSCEFNCLFTTDFISCGQSVNGRVPSREEQPLGNFTSNYCEIGTAVPGTGMTGNERSYLVSVSTAGTYTFDLSVPAGSQADFELILVDAVEANNGDDLCGLFDACRGIAAAGGFGEPEQLTASLPPGNYSLIIDGWYGSWGDFTVSMSCEDDNECGPVTYTDDPNFIPTLLGDGTTRFTGIQEDLSREDLPFLINRQPSTETVFSTRLNEFNTLFINFGNNFGAYEICYPYLDDNECLNYRCTNLCVETPETMETTMDYTNDAENGDLLLSLTDVGGEVGDFKWYEMLGNIPLSVGPSETSTYSVNYSSDFFTCRVSTYYARFYDFDTRCWKFGRRTIYVCNPFSCEAIQSVYRPAQDDYLLFLAEDEGEGPYLWEDDDTGSTLGTNPSLPVPTEPVCRDRNISVKYFDAALEAWVICCTTIEVCSPFSCPDPAFTQNCGDSSQELSLTANGDFFISAEGAAPGAAWLIDREVEVTPQNGGITLAGTNDYDVEICFPVIDANGCVTYCCQQYCLDGSANAPQVLYNYDAENNRYLFDLAEDGTPVTPQWIAVSGSAPPITGNGTSASVPVPANCTTQTYYVRYQLTGCWRLARRTVYLCDPFVCNGIDYEYVASNNTFSLSIEGADVTQPLAWVDDDSGAGLGTTPAIPVPVPPGDCQTRNISVRYYDLSRRAWVICCRTIYLCDPNQCDGIAYQYVADGQFFDLSIPGADLTQPLAWVDDDSGEGLGTTPTIPVPVPPGECQTRNISVRYYDPVRQSWVICCRSVYLCSPVSCEDVIGFTYNDGVAIVNASIGDATRVWSVDGETRGIGTSLAIDLAPGQAVEVCVQYFSPAVNGYRTCCRTISVPDCQLPIVDFFFTEEEGNIAVRNASNPFGEADYLWQFGDVYESTAANPGVLDLSPGTYTVCLTVTNDCGPQRLCRRVTIPDTENDLVFRPSPGTCGRALETIDVPITVLNFQNILNYQFSLGLTDTSVAKIVGMELVNLPGSEDFLIHNAGRVSIIFDSQTGLSYPDGTLMMTMKVQLQNGGPLGTDIVLYPEPVVTYAENGNAEEIGLSVLRGRITPCSEVTVSGRIRNEDGRGIARATVYLLRNGITIDRRETDASGTYRFTIDQDDARYGIRPEKLINYRNHVNSGDLSAMRRHIFNDVPLPGPYRRIAADVGNISSINSGDISLVRQLIFGIVDEFPGVPSWEFVPANHVFADPDRPTSSAYPRTIDLGVLRADRTDQDLIGMKMGDPSNGANPNNLDGGAGDYAAKVASDLAFSVGTEQPIKGVPWKVNVYAHNFRQMVAAQFSLGWDPALVQLYQIENMNQELGITEDNFSRSMVNDGRLPWLWFADAGPVDAPDSTLLFTLSFGVLGEFGDSLNLRFVESPTPFYFERADAEVTATLSPASYVITWLTATEQPALAERLALLPNPTSGAFRIRGIRQPTYAATLYDLSGRQLLNWPGLAAGARLSAGSLPAGVYLVRIREGDAVAVLRLVVQ